MSYFATILYAVSWVFMMSGFLFFRRTNEKAAYATWIPLTIYASMCYNAFFAGILCLIHVPLNLYVFSILDLATGVGLWFLNKKRGALQKYEFSKYDIIAIAILVAGVLIFAQVRYGGAALNWNYKAVDPAARYREAMEYMNWHEVSRMFFAQLNNGMLMQFFAPWFAYDYYYQLYVLGDILNLILTGAVFYGVVKRYAKGHFLHIAAIICMLFYVFGYPLNSTLYGFTYLEMGINIIALIIVLNDSFMRNEGPKWFWVILLMLFGHALFQCYVLFMPITFLAMGICLLIKQKQEGKLFSFDTVKLVLAEFAAPVILGLVYTYMDVFVNDDVQVGNAIAAEGGIYRDLYSNFVFFLPIAIVGYVLLVRAKKNRLMVFLAPFLGVFMFVMFYAGYHARKVSTYYFFKNYYLLWMVVFVLLMSALSHFDINGRRVVTAYFGMWCFVAMMLLTGLETRIQNNNNWYVLDHKSQHMNDLLTFNWNTTQEGPYPLTKMDLMHWVYQNLVEPKTTENLVPVASSEEETYLYESVTGQRLPDYRFWITSENGLERYFEHMDQDTDYVCVFTDSGLYELQRKYFDSFPRVYENSAGFVVKMEHGKFDELKVE